MSGKIIRLIAVSVLLIAGGMHASAETAAPPQEDITVTATKSREMLDKFAKAFETPAKPVGKIVRWEHRVCPVVMGQNPNFTAFITQRIKYVALAVGAPVNTEATCTPNIEIVFTTTPQALLDNIREHQVVLLGYAERRVDIDRLVTVTRPIQAWYTTETRDCNGRRHIDNSFSMSNFTGDLMFWPPVYASSCGLSRIRDNIHSGFANVLIVIDTSKLAGQRIVPLADYISVLALTQLNSLDICQQLPSIVNILAADCGHAADGLTQFDLAYLRGLYKMIVDRRLLFQRNDIADTMVETLAKAK